MATTSKSQPVPISQSSLSLSFITAYGPKLKYRYVGDPVKSRTKQAFKDECDINKIMARFVRTRTLDWVSDVAPRYGDLIGWDYQEALNQVARGKEMFKALPAKVRSRFHNDPAELLDFLADEDNRDEARKLGLLKKPQEAAAQPVATPPATPPTSAAPAPAGEAGGAAA